MSLKVPFCTLALLARALSMPHPLFARDGTATATRHDFANVNGGAACHPPDADIASAYSGRLGSFDPNTRKSGIIIVHVILVLTTADKLDFRGAGCHGP